jgi:hypothetical protein
MNIPVNPMSTIFGALNIPNFNNMLAVALKTIATQSKIISVEVIIILLSPSI